MKNSLTNEVYGLQYVNVTSQDLIYLFGVCKTMYSIAKDELSVALFKNVPIQIGNVRYFVERTE